MYSLRKISTAAVLCLSSSLIHAENDFSSAQVQSILQQNNCLACHQVDRRIVGPSYQQIAEKYQDDPNAAKQLAQAIQQGSQGEWGGVPMPPNLKIKDEDLNTIIDWLMNGAPFLNE